MQPRCPSGGFPQIGVARPRLRSPPLVHHPPRGGQIFCRVPGGGAPGAHGIGVNSTGNAGQVKKNTPNPTAPTAQVRPWYPAPRSVRNWIFDRSGYSDRRRNFFLTRKGLFTVPRLVKIPPGAHCAYPSWRARRLPGHARSGSPDLERAFICTW